MKTKEFIDRLEKAGCRVFASETSDIKVYIDDAIVAYVAPNRKFVMAVYVERLPERVFALITCYASTPVEERKEPKRWRLKVNLPAVSESYYNDEVYLNQNRKSGKTVLSSCAETSDWKTIFTEKDLKDIDETGFKRVPVDDA